MARKEINKSQEKVATGYPEELGKQLDQHGPPESVAKSRKASLKDKLWMGTKIQRGWIRRLCLRT